MTGVLTAVLNAARSKLGVKENPPGSNDTDFGLWYSATFGGHWNGQPWCAMFVNWCLAAGQALDVHNFSYCPTGVAEYKAAGRWGSTPRPGAVVFYQWTEPVPQHVGIVESVNADGSIVAIEGNTSVSVQDNGGTVMRRVRKVGIVGYGYPIYAAIPTQPAPPRPVAAEPLVQYGSTGAAVVVLQRILKISADGIFGPGTKAAVVAFQHAHGLTPDGVVGPMTWAVLNKV
jgi:peptidoglycan hydrolase-like protein with peptidoglycan-binding domain